MRDVITIGDAMITFNPTIKGPMKYVSTFERKVGGAELNFAIGCARLGLNMGWISRLGNDEFGKYIYNFVRGEGVDVSEVRLEDNYPTSLNFKEIMEDGSGRTFYYRDNTPTKVLTEESLTEDYFKNSKLLHITGVFTAIDPAKNIGVIKKAISLAKKHNLLISMDPNIRLKLWTKEEAGKALAELLPDVDILLTGVDEAEILLGTAEVDEIIAKCKELHIKYVAVKRGSDGAVGYHDGQTLNMPPVKPKKVVDTVGAGDGFNAGFIYGILHNWTLEKSLTFANTIGSMVVSVSGDNEGLPYLEDVLVETGEKQFIER
ncbi:sugar kinase [Salipaludibacillus aurantiacus]|uniref:2-dehydro-3-deoxygluconokinase n=1 Tax=Salipaludibacillus aurantiacus TaxID=1601833 RepID=A0A1H9UE77_9BACI|nr:sugar kinase [Salipaludibacillus aurantiacus]SES07363.1 2-dehydro-3-deoxygluconokinase [Salipaludibacillus aurantiacus]